MNVLFHIVTGVGVALSVTNTTLLERSKKKTEKWLVGAAGFSLSFMAHAVLDYMPHCYPLNTKFDFLFGAFLLIFLVCLANKKYRLIVGLSLLGSIAPDLIDLLPSILNSQLGMNLPIYDKIFPWHWKEYSGSMYGSNCGASNLNIAFVLFSVLAILWVRRDSFKRIFNIK